MAQAAAHQAHGYVGSNVSRDVIRAVTFDFWGTLVDGRHDLRRQRAELLCGYLRGCAVAMAEDAYAKGWADFGRGIALGYGLPPSTVLSATLDALGATLTPPVRTAVQRALEELILSNPPALLPGAREVLQKLRRRGLLIGIISDTGTSPVRVLRQFLAQEGMLALFDWLTFSNETGVTKRRPQAFTSTLGALGVAPGDALHAGDLPETDIEGARKAGLHTALVLESSGRRDGIPLADLVLERLSDLPEALGLVGSTSPKHL